MKRQPNPLVRALRRGLSNRDRRSEEGDTLIEILLTVVILGGCALALITTFGTAISASADYRSLAVNATVLRNMEQTTFYQLQQQPSPLFLSCATSTDYTATSIGGLPNPNLIIYSPPTGYSVTLGAVQFWNGTTFLPAGSPCPAPNAPQLITLTINNPNGSIATTQIAVDAIGALSTPVTVTAVSPPTASAGTPSVLLTITGTGFESGATVSFPSNASIAIPGSATFVSPTTLTLFVNLTTAQAGAYVVSVTNLNQAAVPSKSALFTVLAKATSGLHVSAMQGNIADPVVDDPDEDAQVGWDAWDTITVESGSGAPMQGVVVNGTWSIATVPGHTLPTLPIGTSTTTCTTDATGTCTVYYGWRDVLHYVVATFTMSPTISTDPAVGGLVLNNYMYAPQTNAPNSLPISAPTGS